MSNLVTILQWSQFQALNRGPWLSTSPTSGELYGDGKKQALPKVVHVLGELNSALEHMVSHHLLEKATNPQMQVG